jgi:cytoskeleton protein RodZ
MTNFGASFKQARESKGVSLGQIATETRISTRFLTAIENEEFHQLPGGIFNRGFVRAYAERVGLDPDQAVADYERLAGAGEPAQTPSITANPPPAKIERHLYLIAIGALLALIVVFYVVTRDTGNIAQTAGPTAPAPVSEPATPVPAPVTTTPTTPPEQPAETAATEPELPTRPATALSIELEAREPTWIKITTDGTTVVSGEVLAPGTTRKFTAQSSIGVTVGNAAGLSLKINDIQAKPLGRSGQVRELNITPENFKDFTG